MKSYKPINIEAIALAFNKTSSSCMDIFEKLNGICSTDEMLSMNAKKVSDFLDIPQETLLDAFNKVRNAFEKLDPKTVILSPDSELWPEDVEKIPFLYLRGDLGLLKEKSISVVGNTNPSQSAKDLTRKTVSELDKKYVITSGLALGIDGCAHIQALADNAKTIAVIGTPLNQYYPKDHIELQKIIAEKGLLVSQFAPNLNVQKYFFMMRNLLMSQISKGSLVVESRDGGGGVSQAQYSEKQGKPVFIFRETFDNRTFLWPRSFKNASVVSNAGDIIKIMEEKSNTEKYIQPELF